MMTEEKSQEQLEHEWWDAWRKEDFSWEGLDEKLIGQTRDKMVKQREPGPIGLYGEKSLQEYWRRDPDTGEVRDDAALMAAGELIRAPNHKLWHIVHTPLFWSNGNSAKCIWDHVTRGKLRACVSARIEAGSETKLDQYGEYGPEGPDGRAQLAGAVLLDPPTHPKGKTIPIHIDAPTVWFPVWDASDQVFGPGACFDRAFFSSGAYFARAMFGDVARFEMTKFGNAYAGSWFAAASFSGYVTFYLAIFCGEAQFSHATFAKRARIENINFFRKAGFTDTTFSGDVSLGSTFRDDAYFSGAKFLDKVDFLSAKFFKDAHFERTTFSNEVDFYKPTFSGIADFDDATFSSDVTFKEGVFSDEARFIGGHCEGTAHFDNAEFKKAARFETREFRGLVYFDAASFGGPMLFSATVFNKPVSFRRITWPETPRDWHAAFDQALFRETAVFKGSRFKALAAFDGATLERGIQLDDASDTDASSTFEAERHSAIAAAGTDADQWKMAEDKRRKGVDKDATKLVTSQEITVYVRQAHDLRLRELERGCRVLKQAMEQASNKNREQLLHRFELIARRSQCDTPLWERFFSHIYEWTSNYGGSIARPLGVLLLVLIPGFTALYWGWAAMLNRLFPTQVIGILPIADAWASLRFAWTNAFQPFSALASNLIAPHETSWLAAFLTDFGPGWGFAVRVVATTQSVASLVLIFLSGLAVRRRFQIS